VQGITDGGRNRKSNRRKVMAKRTKQTKSPELVVEYDGLREFTPLPGVVYHDDPFTRASIAAMSGIIANPVAWAELKGEAALKSTPILDGLAQASCNAAEALMREIDQRTKAVMPARTPKGTP
jgi:hypothetical protein